MVTKPTSTKTLGKNEKTNNGISQFFRPTPKDYRDKGANRSRTEENNVIVLNDDSDDDLDGNNVVIGGSGEPVLEALVREGNDTSISTKGIELEIFRNEISQTIEIDDNDEHDDEQRPVLQETRTPSKCDEDVVQDEMKKTDDSYYHHDEDLNSSEMQQNSNPHHDLNSSPQKSSIVVKNNKENPFAKFAHRAHLARESRFLNVTRTTWQRHTSTSKSHKRVKNDGNDGGDNYDAVRSKKICTSSKDKKKNEKEFVKIKDISSEEQIKIIRKWHSMADPLASLEVRRYQILLAARLHARCQEVTVRKAILKLRQHFSSLSEAKTITVDEMAKSDPEVLASHISSLQFYNVKAKQIVKAAQEIQSRHGGIVPEDEFSLLQITGIGKTFGDLLAFVNKRETHERLSS